MQTLIAKEPDKHAMSTSHIVHGSHLCYISDIILLNRHLTPAYSLQKWNILLFNVDKCIIQSRPKVLSHECTKLIIANY